MEDLLVIILFCISLIADRHVTFGWTVICKTSSTDVTSTTESIFNQLMVLINTLNYLIYHNQHTLGILQITINHSINNESKFTVLTNNLSRALSVIITHNLIFTCSNWNNEMLIDCNITSKIDFCIVCIHNKVNRVFL